MKLTEALNLKQKPFQQVPLRLLLAGNKLEVTSI